MVQLVIKVEYDRQLERRLVDYIWAKFYSNITDMILVDNWNS